jgi:uncharacterized membrane protein YccF (DUF307 family)
MRTIGNIFWRFLNFGFVAAFINLLFGGLLITTTITSPIGVGLLHLAEFQLSPFSNAMVTSRETRSTDTKYWKSYHKIATIIYLPFGVIIVSLAVIQLAMLALTIIGIPVALALSKSLSTCFNPAGKECVPKNVAKEMEKEALNKTLMHS